MSSRTSRTRIGWCSAALAILLVNGSAMAGAQGTTPGPLPPAAQQALDKGILAAKVPDYLLAIRYFEEARKIVPAAPITYLNLGLAESRVPGRELRAIAWFGAYLAAYPTAPNAAAVKEQIAVLDVKNQSNVSRLIKSMERPPNQTTSPNELRYTVEQINLANLRNVAMLWAKAGDTTAALRIIERIQGNEFNTKTYKSQARGAIAIAQAEAGDIAGAQKTAALLQDGSDKNSAQRAIAQAQAEPSNIPITISDWLTKLDDDDKSIDHHDCALNTGPFLDLDGYLKSLPPHENSQSAFDSSFKTAWIITSAQNIIHQMLKRKVGE